MFGSRFRLTKKAVFRAMLALSLVSLLLPPSWTEPAKHCAQLLSPLQALLSTFLNRAADSARRLDAQTPEPALAAEALRHELESQSLVLDDLRKRNEQLARMRDQLVPPKVPLLQAGLVAWNAVAWRDAAMVNRGASRNISTDDWVASRFFIDLGHMRGAAEGHAVLSQECLLGRIELVSPYVSRVQLFSDPLSPRLEVRIGKRRGAETTFIDYPCSLRGRGKGRMEIEGVPYRHIQLAAGIEESPDAPRIDIGDVVYSAPGQFGLPKPLIVGRIIDITENPTQRLVYSLTIESAVPIGDLRDVFIIPLIPIGPIPLQD